MVLYKFSYLVLKEMDEEIVYERLQSFLQEEASQQGWVDGWKVEQVGEEEDTEEGISYNFQVVGEV